MSEHVEHPGDYQHAEAWAEREAAHETPLVKDLRDAAALTTKAADNPFEARKFTLYWQAASRVEWLERRNEELLRQVQTINPLAR